MAMYRCMAGGGGGVNLFDTYTRQGYIRRLLWNGSDWQTNDTQLAFPLNTGASANSFGYYLARADDLKQFLIDGHALNIKQSMGNATTKPIFRIKSDGTDFKLLATIANPSFFYLTSEYLSQLNDDDIVIIPFNTNNYSCTINAVTV